MMRESSFCKKKRDFMKNIFTIDLEDWYQTHVASSVINFSEWEICESRIDKGTDVVLELLEKNNVKATFFVLGWVAEKFPSLVKKIHSLGHEIASHGYDHKLVSEKTPEEFKKDSLRAKKTLEDITGEPVLGFRASTFSVSRDEECVFDILKELGFKYDSSILPATLGFCSGKSGRNAYDPWLIRKGLWEVPVSVFSIGNRSFPVGGGYFRFLPYAASKMLLTKIEKKRPLVLYFHPWEFDPEQPKIGKLKISGKIRQYSSLGKMKKKCDELLSEFQFGTMMEMVKELEEKKESI